MSICDPLFMLDEVTIIGGDYQEFLFHIHDEDNGGLMDIENLELNLSLLPYGDRYGTPLIIRPCEISPNDATAFLATLHPEDTKDFDGKYIYQITLKAPNDKQKSWQGILTIGKNINPNAFMPPATE